MLVELATEHLLPMLAQEVTAAAIRYVASQTLSVATPRAATPQRTGRPARRRAPMTEVVSDTPGRARLRVLGMRGNPVRAAAVVRRCSELPGIVSADANATTGTLLVRYEPNVTTLATIRSGLQPRAASPQRRVVRATAVPAA